MSAYPLGSPERPLRVAVIGSGPSGFYAVGGLQKADGLTVTVDMFDRLPTPYGLVRGGVAPDHQKIKNVIRKYQKIAADDGFRFFGNVHVGRDVQVSELSEYYDQLVFAVGNESDRKMGIEGEDLEGVYSATEFVGWYNAHPDFRERTFALNEAKRVLLVGNGNVAMDVARVLARHPDELAPTDIADYALGALRSSSVEEILLVGRRGPAQAAFSPAEIKEIGSLTTADLVVPAEEVALDDLTQRWMEEKAGRDAKKNVAYLTDHVARGEGTNTRKVRCKFLVSPVEFIGTGGRLTHVKLVKNELYESDDGTPRPRATDETWLEEVDLVFKAIGYRGVPIAGVPFHERWGIFPNEEGRLTDPETNAPVPGQYVVGWAKRGPSGLIGTNKGDSEATVAGMLEDIQGQTGETGGKSEPGAVVDFLDSRGIDAITFADWELLDQEELNRGEAAGKIREKFTQVDDMLAAIRRLRG
jgi:ferredoxin--NADP+ reductase